MLRIRLSKTGRKNAPAYRIVVAPGKAPRDGREVDVLGHFNPTTKPPIFSLDKERLNYWLDKGAKPTEAVKSLIGGGYKFKPYRPKVMEKEVEKEARPKEAGEGRKEETGKVEDQRPEKKE